MSDEANPTRTVPPAVPPAVPDAAKRLATLLPTESPSGALRTPVGGQETLAFEAGSELTDGPGCGDFGDYVLVEEIARGGMGVIFRAREKSLNRTVALKMVLAGKLATPDQVRRFRHEAEEASRLDHPNIVPIYRVGEYRGQHYFTMKLIEAGTLREQEHGPRADLRRIAKLVADVAHAVHCAHQHGILHRDIKPSNILMDREGKPHVTDFGLVKHLSGSSDADADTQSGAIVGTPGYMSPEQAASRKDLTTATDIYSIGAVLYYLITGQTPFVADSTMDTLVKVLEEDPVPPQQLNSRCDRDLETICLTCMNKDPKRRYASAEALGRDLERYLAGEPIHARRVSRVERVRKWVRRRPLAAALAAVLAVGGLALAGGGWFFNIRLQDAVRKARDAQAVAEQGEQEADRKRQKLTDYLVYLNERLAKLDVDEPLRLEFLNEGLALCEQFQKDGRDDAEARRQTALLYRCLGDLEQERRDPKRAKEAYRRGRELLEQLNKDHPATLYRNDLAVLYSKQAHFQELSGDHAQALATLQKAIDMQDQLAAQPDAEVSCRHRAADFRVTLGTFLEEQKKPDEAEAVYRTALELMAKVAAERALPAATRLHLPHTRMLVAWLLLETKPAEAESLLQRCLRELREVRAAEPDNREYTHGLWGGYTDLAAFYKRRGRHTELAALANQLRADFLGDAEYSYNAARLLTDAVRTVGRQKALPAPERDALTEEYAAQAVTLMDKAIKEGYANRAHIEVDPDLDPLRPRKDFADLLTELERRFPSLSADQELTELQRLLDQARRNYSYQMARARTEAQRQRAEDVKPDLQLFAQKYLHLAKKRRDTSAGMEALVRILETCGAGAANPEAAGICRQAVQLLEQDHFHKPELGSVCMRFARTPVPEAENLLKQAMQRHPQRDVRGLAGLTVTVNLARTGNQVRITEPARAQEMMRQAEQELERLVKEYGNVQVGRSSLGEVARYELDEIRFLSVGSLARDITGQDLNGRPFKLSDFRGKVVMLDFWADWCGFCRQQYPHEQDIVQRFRGKPFVLLGVNRDEDRDTICRTVARKGLGWQSWWDSGPDAGRICNAWHVTHYPTIWVLDHKHVIQYRDVRGKELDEALAKLVQEAEADQAGAK
jgi:peroxiredoxin